MTGDLSLDPETVAAQLGAAGPWGLKPARPITLLRGIGGSSVAFLSVALGLRDPATAPAWIREKAKPMPRRGGMIRGIAQSIGLAASDGGETLDRGNSREPEILNAWIRKLEAGEWQTADERAIDPSTIQWAGALPPSWIEHADRLSPLLVHPDAWALTYSGELVTIDMKCARYGYASPAWWNGATECPWYYGTQLDAYHAVMKSTKGLIVVGCGWNRDDDDPREDGPIVALPHHATPEGIDFVRRVARESWERIPRVYRA